MTARPRQHLIELTPRETEVLALIAQGRDTPPIAKALGITVNTVRSHRQAIFTRLGADNAAHAVALAIGLGLLHDDVATNPTTPAGGSHVR